MYKYMYKILVRLSIDLLDDVSFNYEWIKEFNLN